MAYTFEPIAFLHTCFKEKFGIPRQPNLIREAPARLVFEPAYARPEAVRGLEGFSHIWLVFIFHRSQGWQPMVRPPRLGGNKKVGVFASRSPFRPNPVGMSAVRLTSVEQTGQGPVLHLEGVDILDRTPVLDIKPYLPYSDIIPDAGGGFAPAPPDPGLRIEFTPAAETQCRTLEGEIPNLARIITQMLANDPRPGYRAKQADTPGRIYGARLFDLDVKWQVEGLLVRVLSLDRAGRP